MTRKHGTDHGRPRKSKDQQATCAPPSAPEIRQAPPPVPGAVAVGQGRRIPSPLGPLSRMTRAWLHESARLHEISVDRLGSVIDDSHRLALEGVATVTSIGITLQRGVIDQIERSVGAVARWRPQAR